MLLADLQRKPAVPMIAHATRQNFPHIPYAGRRLETMGIYDRICKWLRRESEERYDNVTITNVADGTTIKGHDAVKEYFRKERELLEVHGPFIIFQVYRMNLEAKTYEELLGKNLMEIKVDGNFVSFTDNVAAVKKRVHTLISERARLGQEAGARPDLVIDEADRISFVFAGHAMRDDKLFYADHHMLLPVWVQVFVHRCEFEEVAAIARRLQHATSDH